MSNEHDPRVSGKFERKLDGASCAEASYQGQRKVGHSSRTIDTVQNVLDREPVENLSGVGVRGRIGEPAKYSQSAAETDSQKDSSWQTIQVSHDGFLPRSSESCSECIDGEAGNLAWKTKGNVAEHPDLQAVWNLKAVSSKNSEDRQLLLGINENLSADLKEKYFWRPEASNSQKMNEYFFSDSKELSRTNNRASSIGTGDSQSRCKSRDRENHQWKLQASSPLAQTPTFANLALDVSYAGLDISGFLDTESSRKPETDPPEFWEDFSVVECLENKLSSYDESTPEERVEALKEVLAETDIHEGDGIVSDFLFHVAKTKYGKIYIRVIRTLLLNRGRI